ncbi:TPA: hypothetical protein DCE37_23495 [Candidatus Latescibacteria bacterium]|nr:hypothetical protein [Candidatus Latescibacterota bacterium]
MDLWTSEISFGLMLMTGLLGSAGHCVGMCGGVCSDLLGEGIRYREPPPQRDSAGDIPPGQDLVLCPSGRAEWAGR